MTEFEASMAKLAASIAEKAAISDKLDEAIDAFKALTPYLALERKRATRNGDEGNESSFADFQAEINGTEDTKNGTSVRGRSRRNRHAS